MLLDYIKLIFTDIKQRKFSSFLTFFAISLGILSIFVIVLVSQGFTQSIQDQFDKMGTNKIIIAGTTSNLNTLTFGKDLSENEMDLIRTKPYIKEAYSQLMKNVQFEYSREFKKGTVLGVKPTEDYFKEFNLNIKEGRFMRPGDKYSLLIGPEILDNYFEKDVAIGSNIYISGIKFKVIGVLESVGNPQDDSQIYMNIDTLREIYNLGNDAIGFGFVVVDENYDVNLAADNLKILLDNRLGEDRVEVTTFEQYLESFNEILTIVKLTLGGIALVSIIVGAIGIINTMYVIVTEKTKDIGIMKSIGATNETILFLFVFQAGMFGFLGGVLGVFFGSIIALVFENIAASAGYDFLQITIDPIVVISLIVFGFVIGSIAGYLPARQAAKLNLIDAIRK